MPSQWRWGLLALSAATIGVSLKGIHDQREDVHCLVRYIHAVADVNTYRSQLQTEQNQLTAQQNKATSDLLLGAGAQLALKPTKDAAEQRQRSQQFRSLFATYAAASTRIAVDTARITADRAAHPLPTLPKDCG